MAEIVSTPDVLGGAPRIEGRRIGVHHVARQVIDAGEASEWVAADYDLDIADVHRALAYDDDDHPEEMRAVRAERRTAPDGLSGVRVPTTWRIRTNRNPKRETRPLVDDQVCPGHRPRRSGREWGLSV